MWKTGAAVVWITACLISGALADESQSDTYHYYFDQGTDAFQRHEDRKALRYFILAQIFDPSTPEPDHYIQILNGRGIMLEPLAKEDQLIGYQYYLGQGLAAMDKKDGEKAIQYFNLAKLFDPSATDPDKYIQALSAPQVLPPATGAASAPPVVQTSFYTQPSVPAPKGLYVAPKAKGPVEVVSLDALVNSGGGRATIHIEMHSSVVIEGRNIQKFLVVDEQAGFIQVKTINRNQVQIDAVKRGSTFLHIWDDAGRRTVYVDVILPKAVGEQAPKPVELVEHAQPFTFNYSNDWSSYYYGSNFSGLERQTVDFLQNFALTGETPYGFMDTSGTWSQFNGVSQFSTYTLGLSHVPAPGTSDLYLRVFDANRFLSPLTMPGTQLRGAFADAYFFKDVLGVSAGTGRKISTYGFISEGGSSSLQSYVDEAQISLFPKDPNTHYALNFARGYGSEHESYLTKQVYSAEGQQKLGNFTVSGEAARDDAQNAGLAGLKWEKTGLMTALNFRDINKDFTTISSFPSGQGEIGTTWSTSADTDNISATTVVDAYRNRLFFNPDDPDALNYDANGHVRWTLTPDVWSDSNVYYVETPGELSPRRSLGLDERISRQFGVWKGLKGTVYAGATYQKSHYAFSTTSDYDRYTLPVGVQLPLSLQLSVFANYEYSWLHEPATGSNSHPNVINAGVSYNKEFTEKFSMTSSVTYRDERGVKGTNSFLAGEDSVAGSIGFAYNPKPDVSFFMDGNTRKVWAQVEGNSSYVDMGVHVGMRLSFMVFPGWDPQGVIAGYVFKDKNGNQQMDAGENGLPGIKVKVGNKETVTDAKGFFHLKLRGKRAIVAPALETLPPGFMFTTPSNATVEIRQGKTTGFDFGVMSQTGIYGVVFIDQNGNGAPDPHDKFIGRIKVTLDDKTTEISDERGAYFFRNITEGRHVITLDLKDLPINLIPLIKLRNEFDVAEGTTYIFHIPMRAKEGADEE